MTTASNGAQERIERLVAECLAVEGEERVLMVQRVLRDHPTDATAIRACLSSLESSGFLADTRSPEALVIPERLGEFTLLRRLGGGGMGEVFAARQESLHREVALKLIRPECLWFRHSRERFLREIEAVGRLHHPGIAAIHATGEANGIPYFAMERVRGVTIADVLREVGAKAPERLTGLDWRRALIARLPEDLERPDESVVPELFAGTWVETSVRIAARVAEALAHAHAHGVLHRDVKPSNLMITPTGEVVLVDFGIAAIDGPDRITLTGSTLGSLDYMSPEQVLGDTQRVDARTDVYSLGALLYEMLALRPPFSSGSNALTRRRILEGQPLPLRALNRAVFQDASTVCQKALAREPEQRYRDAAAFARDLRHLLAHEPIEARPPGRLLRLRRWCQRRPALAVGLGMGALLLVGGPLVFGLQQAAALREYTRLADVRKVRALLDEGDELWPATAEKVPAIDAWLARAADQLARADLHASVRDALRSKAARSESDDWQLEVLDDLDGLLHRVPGLVRRVEERRAFALAVRELTMTGAAAKEAWASAREAVKAAPVYGGLDLAPQLGLVPLGPDPASGLWEFWHPATGACPRLAGAPAAHRVGVEHGLVFVLVPGGTFTMGAVPRSQSQPTSVPGGDVAGTRIEFPAHEVTLAPFFVSKFEMTSGQWLRITGRDPTRLQGTTAKEEHTLRDPVDGVSWLECDRWTRRLGLALPTEAQWEYACRAGTRTMFSFGNDVQRMRLYGNVADARFAVIAGSARLHEAWDDGRIGSGPVGSYLPNPWGLFDVHGNVAEWCLDDNASYPTPTRDGDGFRKADRSTSKSIRTVPGHAIRGGSAGAIAFFARSACRQSKSEDYMIGGLGLRPVRAIER